MKLVRIILPVCIIGLIVLTVHFFNHLQPLSEQENQQENQEKIVEVQSHTKAQEIIVLPTSEKKNVQQPVKMEKKGSLSLAYTSLKKEITDLPLQTSGTLPLWLEGTLLRTGPALFECNGGKANTWFDGCGMLHRFAFTKGNITYSNRFLHSQYWKQVQTEGKFGMQTQAKGGFFSKLGSLMNGDSIPTYDNGNTNICCINGHYCAITETPLYITFDEKNLTSKQHLSFNDKLTAHYACAHSHIDLKTGDFYSYLIQFGNTSTYIVYKIPAGTTKRTQVAKINVSYPAYMHSFAMTENYLILIEPPFRVNPLDLVFGNKSFFETYNWKPKQQTLITVIDKKTGKTAHTYKTDPFFFLHTINAYEEKGCVIIDLVTYQDPSIVYSFNLQQLQKNGSPSLPKGYPTRITINPKRKQVDLKQLSTYSMEMPRINYTSYNAKPYSYVYGVHIPQNQTVMSQIMKLNITNGKALFWSDDNCYPGEPVFVPKPGGKTEDEGVLLITVLDLNTSTSFLLVLDAKNMKELSRTQLPHHIPFDSHGHFYYTR